MECFEAEFNKKKEELEAAACRPLMPFSGQEGQEYEGPPLEELDDDFKEPA